MTSIAPMLNVIPSTDDGASTATDNDAQGRLSKTRSSPNIRNSGGQRLDSNESSANPTSLQDSKRLGFAKSFQRCETSPLYYCDHYFNDHFHFHLFWCHMRECTSHSFQPYNDRLSLNPEANQNNPIVINEKLKSTFVDFCGIVEKGINDALIARFNMIHGVTQKTSDGSLRKSNLDLSPEGLQPPQGAANSSLKHSGSMASLHGRSASRGRQDASPGLKHTRSLHRAGTGRVRSAGRSAACYLQKEESYKLRLTVEARIRCSSSQEPDVPPLPPGLGGTRLPSEASATTSEHEREPSTTVAPRQPPISTNNNPGGLNKTFKSLGGGLNMAAPPTLTEQARDIRNSIKAIIDDMQEPIPGTPIVIVFNAIVYHENSSGGGSEDGGVAQEHALAFSWRSETSTPAGAMIKELKQQRMEMAYKEQGVMLDSEKADAAAAASVLQQKTLVGKLKGLFRSKSSLQRTMSAND
ncbi:hypothetical protein BJ741DRAFT_585527 [Chytriomyces cf. hyalinus JEL632]|nr:hypothetical protein BJ741DRAFT_585527 [Chytriomyces cf. hyalinus JEL632]